MPCGNPLKIRRSVAACSRRPAAGKTRRGAARAAEPRDRPGKQARKRARKRARKQVRNKSTTPVPVTLCRPH